MNSNTEKDSMLTLLEKEASNIDNMAYALHLPARKITKLLEELSVDNEIKFSAGKFKLVRRKSARAELETAGVAESVKRRDYGKYSINGGDQIGKARLVLEIIKKVINDNPKGMSLERLKELFPDSLNKKFGVIQPLPEAIKRSEKHKRFFVDSPLNVGKQTVAVCREWSLDNIMPVIDKAKSMGYKIVST